MSLFFTVAVIQLIALVSPGPDFFFVSQTAVSGTRRKALLGVIGIVLGVVVWSALALLGLQLLLRELAWLSRLIAVAGGIYLAWMGVALLQRAWKAPAAAAHAVPVQRGDAAIMSAGLLTNLANPKAVVYYGSVFSAFLDDGIGTSVRWGLWGLIVAESFLWYALVAVFFTLPAVQRSYRRLSRWVDGSAGTVFVLLGLNLILRGAGNRSV